MFDWLRRLFARPESHSNGELANAKQRLAVVDDRLAALYRDRMADRVRPR